MKLIFKESFCIFPPLFFEGYLLQSEMQIFREDGSFHFQSQSYASAVRERKQESGRVSEGELFSSHAATWSFYSTYSIALKARCLFFPVRFVLHICSRFIDAQI